jgi:hypothetical protein
MLMHGRPLVYRHHAFGRRRTVAQGAMRSDCVVVVPPAFDEDLGFAQRVEGLCKRRTAHAVLLVRSCLA